jgi:serine/threonine protein kinase
MRRAPSEPPVIPGLEFVSLLGTGGFSDVFLYEQQLPRRRVAVKVLLTDGLNTAAQQAFVDEANLMAQLSAHPYIVTIFHADVAADKRPYFVMEYCSGPSLSDLYKREVFGVADALRTGVRLSSAIATAHGAGILHRDIKPANVLTNDFGWPALTDFGISSAVEDELPLVTDTVGDLRDTGGMTESQSVGMSVPWSPPEMFGDAPRPDVRSDVFSLAATIHTLLAGRTPFEIPGRSNGTLDLIGRIERGVITPIGRDDIPRSLVAVLQKGMATRRSERYASAVEFARALQRVELELGYAPTSIEVPNLVVRGREEDAAGDSDDETRVRSVSTITAQPDAPRRDGSRDGDRSSGSSAAAPLAGSGPPGSDDETRARSLTVIGGPNGTSGKPVASPRDAFVEEGTVVRGAPPVDYSTVQRPKRKPWNGRAPEPEIAAVSDPTDAEATGESTRPRRRLAVILSVVALVVVAGVVAASVLTSGGAVREEAGPTTPPVTGDSALPAGGVPTPVFVSAAPAPDDTSVTFTWRNPDPVDGDNFRWALAEDPSQLTGTDQSSVTITRPAPGARVCIEVQIVRAGRTSPAPMSSCNPE